MNKKIVAGTLLLTSVLALTACNKSNPMSEKVSDHNVFNAKVLDANLKKDDSGILPPEPVDFSCAPELSGKYTHNLSSGSNLSVDSTYASKGILKITDTNTNMIGFYSIPNGNYLVKPSFPSNVTYRMIDVRDNSLGANAASLLLLSDTNYTYLIDNIGNVLVNTSHRDNVTNEFAKLVNGDLYLSVQLSYAGTFTFKYNKDGSVEKVTSIPDEIPNLPDVTLPNNKPTFNTGDLFFDTEYMFDLKDVGYEGYYVSANNKLATVYKNKEPIATYAIPDNARPMLVGKSIILQNIYALPEDATDYDFFEYSSMNNSVIKYDYDTKKIDLISGKISDYDCDFIIQDSTPYKDEDGLYKYALLDLCEINDSKALEPEKTILVDENVKLLDNLTGLNVRSFVKVGENYYNKSTHILYDNNLKIITELNSDRQIILNESLGVFKITKDGHDGIIDKSGKVVIPFIYDEIIFEDDNNYAFVKLNNTYSAIDLTTGLVNTTYPNSSMSYETTGNMNGSNKLYSFKDNFGETKFASLKNPNIISVYGNKEATYEYSYLNDDLAKIYKYYNSRDNKNIYLGFRLSKDLVTFRTANVSPR